MVGNSSGRNFFFILLSMVTKENSSSLTYIRLMKTTRKMKKMRSAPPRNLKKPFLSPKTRRSCLLT